MWRAIDAAVDSSTRDSLWDHPDVLPSADDIDDPHSLIARLTSGSVSSDDIDEALRRLLDDPPVDDD
jgi:hypothetical protein